MSDGVDRNIGAVLRFVASRGWADEDADLVHDLLADAHRLADLAIADATASPELRATAAAFLARLSSDTFGEH